MDDNYQSYINRVAPMTLPNNYLQQLENIQKATKFHNSQPVSFPGYSIISPPAEEDSNNREFYEQLANCQKKLSDNLDTEFFITIPPSTFHLTIADLIWEKNYLNSVAENPDFDQKLINEIALIFENYQNSSVKNNYLELELLGLSVFPRAITVCLAPTESSYQKVIELRRKIYQNRSIIKLGIEQQYNFIAHVTLGYFGEIKSDLNLNNIQNILTSINDEWLENEPPICSIKQVELRKFENMINYTREENWATIQF